jgi:2'-5' RNA ligase
LNYLGDQFTSLVDALRPIPRLEQNFALVLNTPPEVAAEIDDIRRRYDPAYHVGFAPHITIKRPAMLGNMADLETMRQVLREVIESFEAIPVQLQGYDIFRSPGSHVLFLKVVDEKPFCELHQRVLQALTRLYPNGHADHFENSHYHPHVTIGNKLSDLDLAVLEHELAGGDYRLDFSFTLTHLSLLVHESNQPWEVVENFSFPSPPAKSSE